jgi:hypothetical protein
VQIVDFELVRGDDFSRVIQFRQNDTPLNITTWTLNGQLRQKYDATTKTTLALTKVDASIGLLRITLTKAQTAALKGVYVWDIERTVTGATDTPVGGQITVSPDVTRIEA